MNILWIISDKFIRLGVGLFLSVWVARYLGPSQFGQLQYAIAFLVIFTTFSSLGLQGVVVQKLINKSKKADDILQATLFLHLIGSTIGLLSILTINQLTNDSSTSTYKIFLILSITLIFHSMDGIKYWFEAITNYKYIIWVENIAFLFSSSIKIILISTSAPVEYFALTTLLESIVIFTGIFILKRKSNFHLFLNLKNKKIKHYSVDLFKASWPLVIANLSIVAYMKIDQIMIGHILGDKAVGLYSTAVIISQAWYFIPVAINTSMRPLISEIKKESNKAYLYRLQYQFNLMIWISVPPILIFTLFSEDIIRVVLGEAYIQSAEIVVIHIWSGIFVALNNTAWIWHYIEETQKIAAVRVSMGLLLNIVLNLILIPSQGIMGAAYATLISRAISSYLGHIFIQESRILFIMMTQSILTLGLSAFRKQTRT